MESNGEGKDGPVKGNQDKQPVLPLSPVVFLPHHSVSNLTVTKTAKKLVNFQLDQFLYLTQHLQECMDSKEREGKGMEPAQFSITETET